MTWGQTFEDETPIGGIQTLQYPGGHFDGAIAHLENPSLQTDLGIDASWQSLAHSCAVPRTLSRERSLSPTLRNNAVPILGSASFTPSVANSQTLATRAVVRVLSEYPSLLMKGSFLSPFLHLSLYSLYSNIVPDMSFLPQTAMAICCSGGITIPGSNRFFRRAIDAARQRLIGSFVRTVPPYLAIIRSSVQIGHLTLKFSRPTNACSNGMHYMQC